MTYNWFFSSADYLARPGKCYLRRSYMFSI